MKKLFFVFSCLCLALFLLTACGAQKPYEQYLQAYEELQKEDSFIVEYKETVAQNMDYEFWPEKAEKWYGNVQTTYQLQNGNAIADMLMLSKTISGGNLTKEPVEERMEQRSYFKDGYLYTQSKTEDGQNHGQEYEEDFARRIVTNGIIQFPENTVLEQSMQEIPEGLLLTFKLDGEKYYAHRFPQNSGEEEEEYEYSILGVYREPPLYTVLLDAEGRIKQVRGQFFIDYTGNYNTKTDEQSYEINFLQYGGVQLDFPPLDKADYPDWAAMVQDE